MAKEEKNSQISLEDLLNAEKAAKIICQNYEKSLRNYDGSIDENNEGFKKFDHFNKVHIHILELLEKEIDRWEF